MKTENIRNRLTAWSKAITSAYIGLKIRFEYSCSWGVFLVSCYTDEIADMERFSADVLAFEDEMRDLYGDDAPLFCDNEELFRLSAEAETVVGLREITPVCSWHIQLEWVFTSGQNHNLAA